MFNAFARSHTHTSASKDPDPGRISKHLEQLCQIVQLVFLWDGLVYNLQKIFMDLTAITDFHFFIYVFFHSEYLDIIIKDFSQTKYGLH